MYVARFATRHCIPCLSSPQPQRRKRIGVIHRGWYRLDTGFLAPLEQPAWSRKSCHTVSRGASCGNVVYSRNRERPLVDQTDIESKTYPRQEPHIGIDKSLAMAEKVGADSTILHSLVNSWPVDRQLAAVILNV